MERDTLKFYSKVLLGALTGIGFGLGLNWWGTQRFEARAQEAFGVIIPCIDRDGNGLRGPELDSLYMRYQEAGGSLGDTIRVSSEEYEFRIGGDNLDSLLEFCRRENRNQ